MTSVGALTGKVALVSGAGSVAPGVDNGRAISIQLARAGAAIGAVDISLASAEETVRMVEAEGGLAVPAAADVSEPADAARAVQEVVEHFGRIDILVNNVGIVGSPR